MDRCPAIAQLLRSHVRCDPSREPSTAVTHSVFRSWDFQTPTVPQEGRSPGVTEASGLCVTDFRPLVTWHLEAAVGWKVVPILPGPCSIVIHACVFTYKEVSGWNSAWQPMADCCLLGLIILFMLCNGSCLFYNVLQIISLSWVPLWALKGNPSLPLRSYHVISYRMLLFSRLKACWCPCHGTRLCPNRAHLKGELVSYYCSIKKHMPHYQFRDP